MNSSDSGLIIPLDQPAETSIDAGPLGILPYLSGRQVRLENRVGRDGPDCSAVVEGWDRLLGERVTVDRFGVQWRGSGLKRPGVVAQFFWPRLRSRLALGIDPPLAHALVDRLLGFERTAAEARLQVSPVEWGILAFLVASGLEQLERSPGPLGAFDLTIDRVGPDPFDAADFGPIVTFRWRVRVGEVGGSARLWVPESLLTPWLDDEARPASTRPKPSGSSDARSSFWEGLGSDWRAEAGSVSISTGSFPDELRVGRLLLLDDRPLTGTTASPEGVVFLVQQTLTGRAAFSARVEPGSSGDRLVLTSKREHQPTFRDLLMADPASNLAEDTGNLDAPPIESTDVTVTLTVELGRVSLPLRRLASLQAGDVVELARHARDPVDLSSNGRLVARGELVQVDTELGVRITRVFF